ncbi:DNA-directed primase/polymerase protein [Patella vulgata]|uniref:DNA-directed primase/polymerase protein n=1 Tax=Patella vulgata TaxID=6465 RepID=UPI00217FDDED|nr:DNA-directed primase/polymerase protein [Patella vulgata]
MDESSATLKSSLFYGVKSRKRRYEIKSQIEKRLKRHTKLHLPQDYKPRLGGPSSSWKTFFKQNDAFDFCRKTAEADLHVFAFEKQVVGEEKGQRMYLVTSYPVFWHYYRQLPCDKRLHYEIIPEGSVCKLYFDLEYLIEFNPSHNGDETVEIFIKYICYWLKRMYNIECNRCNVLDLDASTDRKFSRHLIFQLNDVAFRNNIEAGYFVSFIMKRLQEVVKPCETGRNISDSGIDLSLDIEEDENAVETREKQMFVDQESNALSSIKSVSKDVENLPEANKLESTTCNSATSTDTLHENIQIQADLKEEFNVDDLKSLLVYRSCDGDVTFVCDTGVYTKNRNFRLYLSNKLGKRNPLLLAKDNKYKARNIGNIEIDELLFIDSLISNVSHTDSLRILSFDQREPVDKMFNLRSNTDKNIAETIEGNERSPYPEIDMFIFQLVNGDKKKGFIRHWTYFTAGELLIYDIGRYRWCYNIGRQHKSNNIMFVVDLKKGVYYQKCHDPDCKLQGFKSKDEYIPQEILPSYYLDDLFDSDEDDFLMAVEQAEDNLQNKTQTDDLSDNELMFFAEELEKGDMTG